MPTYTAKCYKCDEVYDYVRSVDDRFNTPECCGAPTKKVILTAPLGYIMGKFEAFKSPVDGSVISSAHALREHNARNGVVSMADGYSEETILSGNFQKPKPKSSIPDMRQDLAEAVHMVNNGYKPTIEVQEDE